jgi:hypothetical protein
MRKFSFYRNHKNNKFLERSNTFLSLVPVGSTQGCFHPIEKSHVKTNLVHILHRVKATGIQPLESLKDLLTDEEYKRYK